jgi:hypothetical protein
MVFGGVGSCGEDEGGECEEAEKTKPENLFSPDKKSEKSLKEETSWIKGTGPWALNHVR